MPRYLCQAMVGATTGSGRSGSWSENYYRNASSINDAYNALLSLMSVRLAIASTRISWYGARFRDLDSPGSVRVFKITPARQGTLGAADTPFQTLTTTAFCSSGNKRIFKFKGVPDAFIVDGVFVGGLIGDANLAILRATLISGGWQVLGTNFSNPMADVLGVAADGTYLIDPDLGLTPSSVVKFFRTFDVNGKGVKGTFRVAPGISSGTGTIRFWPNGRVVQRGKMRVFGKTFQPIVEVQTGDMIATKLGRNFFPYVGRRLVRR